MTEFEFLSTLPWTDRLAWTLIHFFWQGALLCGAFVAVRSLLASSLTPRARYGLACTALALMAIAPVITFLALSPGVAPRGYAFRAETGFAAAGAGGWHLAESGFLEALLPWIVAAWLTGAFAFSLRLAGAWFVAVRLRFAGAVRPAPGEWQRRLNTLAECIGIARPVRLLVSSVAQTPMAVGHLRPVVLAPIGALTGLPAEQVEALLAHELAHIWRNDYLANLLQSVVEALLFYHPSVWWLSKQIRIERELCCDDIAVAISGDRVLYARALADLEACRPAHAQAAMAANGGDLLPRIRRLVDPSVPQPRPGLGAAITLGVLLLVGGAAATVRQSPTVRVKVAFTPMQPAGANEPVTPVTAAAPQEPRRNAEPSQTRTPEEPRQRAEPAISQEERESRAQREESSRSEQAEPRESRAQAEERMRAEARESRAQAEERNRAERGEPRAEGRRLIAIEIRGLSDEAGNELLARLPVHEGDRLASNSLERVGSVARQFGERMEYRLDSAGDDAVTLHIHPAGLANGRLIRQK